MKKLGIFCVLIVFLGMTGCSDGSGKKELCKALFADYTAEAEYVFEFDGNSVAGTAIVTKGENVRIDITSPDPYTGISVVGNAVDNPETLSISFSGIKAELPANALDRLNLVLTVFGNRAADTAEKTGKDKYKKCEEVYTLEGLGEVDAYETSFSVGDIEYIYVYDRITGIPVDICAKSGGSAVEIKIKKFKMAE